MSDYDQQYVPQASIDTATDDALSVRARDDAASINNTKLVFSPRISDAWPHENGGLTAAVSKSSDTNENIVLMYPRVFTGFAYDQLHWTISANRTSGTSTIIWRLYWGWAAYGGVQENIGATDKLTMLVSDSSSLTVNSSTANMYSDLTLKFESNPQGYAYYVITAQNGDGSTQGVIYSLAITPWLSTA